MLLRTALLGLALLGLSTPAASADDRCPECLRQSRQRANETYVVGRRAPASSRQTKPEDAQHYYLEGRILARRGHWEAATDVLETAVRMAPREGSYHLLLGKVLQRSFDNKGAIEHFGEAWKYGNDRVQEEAGKLLNGLGVPPKGPPPENNVRWEAETQASAAVQDTREESLYERLGGRKAIEAVVDELLDRAGKDPRIAKFFMGMNMDGGTFRNRLVTQIGQATGGPEIYKGRSMKDAHEGLGIRETHFKALVDDLAAAMKFLKVPRREQNELMSLLAPMKADIVE